MKKSLVFALSLLFALSACIEKPVPPEPVDDDPPTQEQEPEDPPVIDPEAPKVKDVTLMEEFSEEFSSFTSQFFDFEPKSSGEDFRYYSGFPSLSESGNTILMLRLDEAEKAVIRSKEFTYYGSYSARIRIPDISSVQPKVGASVDFALYDNDEEFGEDEILLSLHLSEQSSVHVDGQAVTPDISGFNAATKYYIYGIDWEKESITWWVKTKVSGDKVVLATLNEDVPDQPLRLELRFGALSYGAAPLYPYELETDWIKYTPSEQ